MSTRSEIRFVKNGKLVGCVYHHMDGYPSHIINDIHTIHNAPNAVDIMKGLSIGHGTQDPKCAFPKSMDKHQGDIEYSYVVEYSQERKKGGWTPSPQMKNVKIFTHTYNMPKDRSKWKDVDWGNISKDKKLIFDGDIDTAHEKFVLKGDE
jgi:hypothetical protein